MLKLPLQIGQEIVVKDFQCVTCYKSNFFIVVEKNKMTKRLSPGTTSVVCSSCKAPDGFPPGFIERHEVEYVYACQIYNIDGEILNA